MWVLVNTFVFLHRNYKQGHWIISRHIALFLISHSSPFAVTNVTVGIDFAYLFENRTLLASLVFCYKVCFHLHFSLF